jgi:hypothetical protein
MKFERINNTTATLVDMDDGKTILFSYSTPVACFIPGVGYYRTNKYWSRTTTKHINKWIIGKSNTIEQSALDMMVRGY